MKARRISLLLLLAVLAMTLAGMTSAISTGVAFGARPATLSGRLTPHSTPSLRTSTVFGKGPELHLLPDIGPVGTRVSVVGLGYPPGAHIRIIYAALKAEFMPQPLASASVAANGTFRTAFTVTCAFVVLHSRLALHPPKVCPLSAAAPLRAVVVGTLVDQRFLHQQSEIEGFVVTG